MSDHDTDGGERLAPVVPLFGGTVPDRPVAGADEAPDVGSDGADDWHTTWRGAAAAPPVADEQAAPADDIDDESDGDGDESQVIADRATRRLERALAARGMSEREARDRLRRDNVEPHAVEDIIDRLLRVGAIDDDRLAEQLLHAALTRKNQGRRAIAQALAKRGIARESIDAALEDLPDDDYERALEFARGKAPQLARFDHETALRRLVGQLSRRGFGGSLVMSVARQALDEAQSGTTSVRFR